MRENNKQSTNPAPRIYTTAPSAVPEPVRQYVEQELLRLPRSGERDAIYGQSRSAWNLLILPCKANGFKPPIKSISLRKPDATRGVRCIVAASAKKFFDGLIAEAAAAEVHSVGGDAQKAAPTVKPRKGRPIPRP